MSAAIGVRDDYSAEALRLLAGRVKDANQARRLLAIAAVYDGMDREEAASIGGMDRQTLRDWVLRFNELGPAGLINIKPPGRRPRLSEEQKEELCRLVEAGPDPQSDGVVRWRCVDETHTGATLRRGPVGGAPGPDSQGTRLLAYQRAATASRSEPAGNHGV